MHILIGYHAIFILAYIKYMENFFKCFLVLGLAPKLVYKTCGVAWGDQNTSTLQNSEIDSSHVKDILKYSYLCMG